jgi:hypothetical protein
MSTKGRSEMYELNNVPLRVADKDHAGWCACLDAVIASLVGFPFAGCDEQIAKEVTRIAKTCADEGPEGPMMRSIDEAWRRQNRS